MPRRKTGGDEYEAKRKPRADEAAAASDNGSVPGLPVVQALPLRHEAAEYALNRLMSRTDGWLRFIPWGDGKQGYVKYKFTHGDYAGMYVMYVITDYSWLRGVLGVFEKVREVDEGIRRPSPDTFYDPQ